MEIPDDVAHLARSIAERLPVDWKSVEDSPDAAWRETVRELKVIAEIAAFHHHGDTDEPPTTWGPFRLLERVGRGAYGDVYRAIDTRLDREVALKLVRESDTSTDSVGALVIEEARLLARLRHPNVVTIHGADRIDGRVGLWMELVDGRTLEQLLKEEGPMAPRDLAVLCVDVCRALAAVHDAGLLHRDIKAQNVMRDANDRHVLMDFGAGRMAEPTATEFAGTPLYLAPELLHGAAASCQSDIYAVGVLLFRLATGRYPFEGASVEELRAAHHAHARTALASLRPDYPDALVALVERALSEQPSDRFGSAGEMGDLAATMVKVDPPGAGKRVLVWSLPAVLALAALVSASWLIKGDTNATEAGPGTRLVWDEATDLQGTTSADGRLLSFTDGPTGRPAVRDLRSGETKLLADGQAEPGEAGRSAVSPDGKQVAYGWLPEGAQVYELRAVETAGGRSRTLPLGATVQYVEPHAWSPDGRSIAVAVGWPGGSAVQFVYPDGTTTRTVADLAGRWPTAIRVSPDGQWVALHVQRRLLTARADGSSLEPIPAAPAATLLTWMPDGRLLFTRERDGGADVYALAMSNGRPVGEPMKVDALGEIGRMVRIEMAPGRGVMALGVTPSGALIYGRTTVASNAVTVAVDPASGEVGSERVGQPVAAYGVGGGLAGGIRYSPDGARMLWTPTDASVTIRESDGRTRTIAPQLQQTGRLEWAPDGRSLIIAGHKERKPGVFRVDLDTGSASPLLVGERPSAFCLSVDGRTLYFERGDGAHGDVIARDLQSGAERSVQTVQRTIFQLKMSRDGHRLAVMTQSGINVMDVTTRKVRLLASGPADGGFSGGDWTPDGRWFFATVSYGDVHPRAELWSIPVEGGEPLKRQLAVAATGGWMRPDGREFSMLRTVRRQQVWTIENFLPPQ